MLSTGLRIHGRVRGCGSWSWSLTVGLLALCHCSPIVTVADPSTDETTSTDPRDTTDSACVPPEIHPPCTPGVDPLGDETAPFQKLEYLHETGGPEKFFWFVCAEPFQAHELTLERGVGGRICVSGTYYYQIPLQDEPCPDDAYVSTPSICLILVPLAPFELLPDEQQQLDALIQALPHGQCVIDPQMTCDRCEARRMMIDGQIKLGECCGVVIPDDYGPAIMAIEDFLIDLVAIETTCERLGSP
jgi:hypothetical protein